MQAGGQACACRAGAARAEGGRARRRRQRREGRLPIAHCADRAHVRAGEDGGIRDGGVVKEVAIRAVGRAVGRAVWGGRWRW